MSKNIAFDEIENICRTYKKRNKTFLSTIVLFFLMLPISLFFLWFIFVQLSLNMENIISGTFMFCIFIAPLFYLLYKILDSLPIYIFIYRIEHLHKILDTIDPRDYNFEELGGNISKIASMLISSSYSNIKTKKGEIIFYTNQYVVHVLENLMKELEIRIFEQRKLLQNAQYELTSLKGYDKQSDFVIEAQIIRLQEYLKRFSKLYEVIQESLIPSLPK